jgi:hypothetical protein
MAQRGGSPRHQHQAERPDPAGGRDPVDYVGAGTEAYSEGMESTDAPVRGRRAARANAAAFIWSLGLILAAVFVPVYGQAVTTSSGPTLTTLTLIQENGIWVLIPVAAPALICAVVAVALRRKCSLGSRRSAAVAWVATGVLAALTLISIASIGLFLVPVVVLLAWAARVSPLAPA